MNNNNSEKSFSKEEKIIKEKKVDQEKKDLKIKGSNDTKQLKELQNKNKELEEKILRLLAETENLRKRHEREINESQSYAIKNFASSLLSIADNFQRALQAIPGKETDNILVKNLAIGIRAVEKEFFEVFEKNGITKFSSLNKKFDPEVHQAVSKVNHDKIEKGFICDELQLGFKIGERLLRPAMVVVSEGIQTQDTSSKNKSNQDELKKQ